MARDDRPAVCECGHEVRDHFRGECHVHGCECLWWVVSRPYLAEAELIDSSAIIGCRGGCEGSRLGRLWYVGGNLAVVVECCDCGATWIPREDDLRAAEPPKEGET